MNEPDQADKILSSHQLLLLSREELVLQAQDKIKELEASQKNRYKSTGFLVENVSGYPKISRSQDEVSLATSTESIFDEFDRSKLVNQLELRLKNFTPGDIHRKRAFEKLHPNDEVIVAYEYKGAFPSCDEDLSPRSISEDDLQQPRPRIIIDDGTWNEDEDGDNHSEILPLIPSPVLNTPPYEYIFLTKSNEAKYRIFLNQKLDKVFQEEIHKLQVREEQLQKGQSQYVFEDVEDLEENQVLYENEKNKAGHAHKLDIHNKNHVHNTPSVNNDINGCNSASNVIHCFDPSEVDLELKKIFIDKPPITHKIVRRRSRRQRGSSVPAVDSYYGTKDLNKVGHASYFIPTLTESERKAIGWKSEYHYGHWKYATLTLPNPNANQISLHPHVDLESDAHHHHHHHSGILPNNPLHHHEIDLSEPFIDKSEDGSWHKSSSTKHHRHNHHQQHNHNGGTGSADENDDHDPLSFITLSGCSNDVSHSCHIIPDKGTLRKILKWILPCIKKEQRLDSAIKGDTKSVTFEEGNNDKTTKHHELETLVEPSGKLNFPTSHTSFLVGSDLDENEKLDCVNEDMGHHEHKKQRSPTDHQSEDHNENHHQHGHHTNHSHHHGIFHWKNILSHHDGPDSDSQDSMNVVGGDVVASVHDRDYFPSKKEQSGRNQTLKGETRERMQMGTASIQQRATNELLTSSTESDTENAQSEKTTRKKPKRKLKLCKAYTKLLTLKDLGYETDPADALLINISQNSDSARPIELVRNEKVEDDLRSSSSKEYPLISSLSISHQNSALATNLVLDDSITASVLEMKQHPDRIETRFLDPKDLLIPGDAGTGLTHPDVPTSLPFDFNFDDLQFDEENITYFNDLIGQQEDENVIEWMDGKFTTDIEEDLGQFKFHMENLIKQKEMHQEYDADNEGDFVSSDTNEPEASPAKIPGQHRITTLNEMEKQIHLIKK